MENDTLREEHRFWVYDSRILRRIFGPKRKAVAGLWRRLHNEELHTFYISRNIIMTITLKRIRWAEHVAYMGEMRKP
jgi:hypothetical protein